MMYQLNIEWDTDHYLKRAIINEMRRRWDLSCFMSSRSPQPDHFFGEEIDILADYLLQMMEKSPY